MANLVFDFLHNYKTGERRESDPADAYQYDEGHVFEAVVPVAVTSCEIHYWARGFDEAEAYTPASITQNTDNSYTITGNIPNKFFETYGNLRVYIVVTDGDASITTYEGRIHICERSKPDDYVDDDPDNEATRVLVEARAAAATATEAAQTAQDVADSIPADYTQLSDDVSSLKEELSGLGSRCVRWDKTTNYDLYEGYRWTTAYDKLSFVYGDAIEIEYNAGDQFRFYGKTNYSATYAYRYLLNDNTIVEETTYDSSDVGYHTITPPNNCKALRITFDKAYPDWYVEKTTFTPATPYSEFTDKTDRIITASKIFTQYLNKDAWEHDYYYTITNSAVVKNRVQASGSNYYCQKLTALKAGKYYFNAFCDANFTVVEKISDGTVKLISDYGVSTRTSGAIELDYDFNLYVTLYVYGSATTDVAMFANGIVPLSYVYGLYNIDGIYRNSQGQTIYTVGNGYVDSIQSACDMASDGDIIYIRCGVYTEQVSIWTRKLHLIGEDKLNTILIDHSGNYDTPPLEMAMGTLSNMTIIEDGTNPTVNSDDSRYMMAYCLHIEHPNAAGQTFDIDNCNFINHIHVPLGCGLRANNTVRFRNCRFYCGATDEGVSQERGAFFVHSVNSPDADNQWIIAENCTMESKGQRLAAMFGVPSGANNTGHMYIRLSNCCLWNENRGVSNDAITWDTNGGADVMELSHSYGNTISMLNSNTGS